MGRDGAGYDADVSVRVRRTARAWLAGCAAATVLSGCVPAEPSAPDWRSQASQALEDTGSEVESVALVLRLQSDDRLPGRAARVAAVESEEAVSSAEQTLSTLQPPPGTERADARTSPLMTRAADLVRQARIALTAGDTASYDDLRSRLLDLSDALDRARSEL